MSKVNLYALILLLLLVKMSVGCSAKHKFDGSRQGGVAELSGGMAVVSANEEWTTHKYSGVPPQAGPQAAWIREQTEIQRMDHNEKLFPKPLAFNAKLGFGVSNRLIISARASGDKILGIGPGLTLFLQETAPSLFVDIFMPIGSYYYATNSTNIIIREVKSEDDSFRIGPGPVSVDYVETNKPLTGQAISIGIGYEFTKHWTIKMDVNIGLGVYSYNISKSTQFSYPRSSNAVDTYTVDTPRAATAYSFGLTMGYIWY